MGIVLITSRHLLTCDICGNQFMCDVPSDVTDVSNYLLDRLEWIKKVNDGVSEYSCPSCARDKAEKESIEKEIAQNCQKRIDELRHMKAIYEQENIARNRYNFTRSETFSESFLNFGMPTLYDELVLNNMMKKNREV